jgi:large subunit ribosomal protein L7/L12
MSDAAVLDVPADLQTLGDTISGLTLKQAKQLSDYIEEKYGIKPAAGGGAVMMAAPADGGGAAAAKAEPTEFDVILTSFGEKKLDVVKVVKNITGASLMDAKKLVEAAPSTIKDHVSKEDANKIKAEIEAVGGKIELKGVG